MKKYHIVIDNQTKGPFTPEELRMMGLNARSLIWYEGLPDWVEASQVPELRVYLHSQTPPPPSVHYQHSAPKPKCPNTYLALAIISTILCCLPLGIVSIVYAASVETRWASGRYDEAKDASRKARNWAIASIVTSAVFIVIYVILMIISAANIHSNSYYY